ncbi:HlyD family efflux transporter periplasmic adaptor subunit [Parafrankia elaeagni]|uniref:HlyD family efflux transporter periplasmic adaptor subunit n=1 Tax=Parafrankia elaeagni TaxID=222534 RepID=UPI0003A16922|nr:biotin/lipoyl-binding protein [Parafrankia elaeagni]
MAALAVAGAGVGAGLVATADDGVSYRLAAATTGSVTQTLTSVGTLGTVNTSTLSFPVGGVVTAVPVRIGDRVSAGQALANLDPAQLQSALNTANEKLANARLTLANDASGQTSGAASQSGATTSLTSTSGSGAVISLLANAPAASAGDRGGSAGVALTSSSGGTSTAGGGSGADVVRPGTALVMAVTAAQRDVIAAQSALDAVLADLGADLSALTAQDGGCAVTEGSPSTPISFTATPVPTGESTGTSTGTGTISGTVGAKDTVTLSRAGAVIATRTGPYTFTGLDAGSPYTVTIRPAALVGVVDATACQNAIGALVTRFSAPADASGMSGESNLGGLTSRLASAKADLDAAVRALGSTGTGTAPTEPSAAPSSTTQPSTAPSPSPSPSTGPASSPAPSPAVRGGKPTPTPGGGTPSSGGSGRPTAAPTPSASAGTDGGTGSARPGAAVPGGDGSSPSDGEQPGSGQPDSGQSGGGQSGGGASGGASGSGASGRTTQPASAEKLAADQAAVDAAVAQVAVAQQNLNGATLTSPISGTVAALSIEPGSTVGAFSSSATVTVLGDGDRQITTTVPLSAVDLVKVSNPATVIVDGVAEPLAGTVSSIGALDSTTGSTTTYPVRIVLKPTDARLFDGTGATVSIRVREVRDVLTVPTSAVHRSGQLSTVTVVRDGRATAVRVQTGAVGPERTEVTSGLEAGDQVSLAEINAGLPSGDSDESSGNGGLFGGGGDANSLPGGGPAGPGGFMNGGFGAGGGGGGGR